MKPMLGQFIRYGIIGVLSNAVGYLLYLGITAAGVGPKLAMSLVYVLGILQTFTFNKRWSFRFNGATAPALVRYATIYALGYLVNLLALVLLVDRLGLPHQWVMAGLVLFMALFFFVGQKFWAFRQNLVPEQGG
ncbi:MAG: GtrA family protein [Propionivibrio sp.]|uniref:GtrA family protein n=1 Tax=Propionivibrio sp. TaxID=2212460 RepID=UPI0025CC09FE|nr:GtrA family protein [Propionivibrio sp.]MBK8893854.1 GtrA family protein [Propionivibrio sp.]